MLNQCLESLVQKIQSGVVINFEKTGPDPPPLEGKTHLCLFAFGFSQVELSFIIKGAFWHVLCCMRLISRGALCSLPLGVCFNPFWAFLSCFFINIWWVSLFKLLLSYLTADTLVWWILFHAAFHKPLVFLFCFAYIPAQTLQLKWWSLVRSLGTAVTSWSTYDLTLKLVFPSGTGPSPKPSGQTRTPPHW